MRIGRLLQRCLLSALAGLLLGGGWTGEILGPRTALAGGGHCPHCSKPCYAVPEVVKVEKPFWKVEHKEICIPAIKFPWSKCCEPPRCGRVITVKVLEQDKRECEKCGYKWEIPPCRTRCRD